MITPTTTFDQRYSSDGAEPISWLDGRAQLHRAELYWVTTIRAKGRAGDRPHAANVAQHATPHITPTVGVWLDDALYFSSGPAEQKSRNLAANPKCAVTTGSNRWAHGSRRRRCSDSARATDSATLDGTSPPTKRERPCSPASRPAMGSQPNPPV